jgi:chaperonin cofactor prefoldin
MLQKVDSKVLVAVALIIGLIIGFVGDNTLISRPRIQSLTDQTTAQQEQITMLEAEVDSIQNNYDSLQTQYEELGASAQKTSEEQVAEIEQLESQIEAQYEVLIELGEDKETLEVLVEGLQESYSSLEAKYNELYNPLITEFTANGLEIEISITNDIYTDNTPIYGTVKITESDGSPFKGTFKLSLNKMYTNSGTPSDVYSIDEEIDFSWSGAFVIGAGSYKLNIIELKDDLGNIVVPNVQLRAYPLFLFMG